MADVAVHTPLIVAVFDFGQGRTGWDPRVEGGGEPGGGGGNDSGGVGVLCGASEKRLYTISGGTDLTGDSS